MLRRLLFILLVMSVFGGRAEGIATWLNPEYDFGTFKEEHGKVTGEIKMVNTGDSEMIITSVSPTCGCTASDFTKSKIVPGDTAIVKLTYDPTNRPGEFEKYVYVYTNGIPKRSTLVIRGNVIGSYSTINKRYPEGVGALKLDRRIIPFGEMIKGKSHTLFIDTYNLSEDSIIIEFANVPEYLQVEALPDTVAPGEQSVITITYHSEKCDEWGFSHRDFTIETLPVKSNSGNMISGIGKIEVTAILQEDFSRMSRKNKSVAPKVKLSTEKVDFGRMSIDETEVSSFLEITNTGKSPLKIRRIYTLDKGVSVKCGKNEIKPGKKVRLDIKIKPNEVGELLNAKLVVITNDPEKPQYTVRLVGQIINEENK